MVRFEAVHGPGCAAEWFYADPRWKRITGGWTRDGCTGRALALKVSAEPGHFTQMVNWMFATRPGARCTFEVHVPDDSRSAGTARYHLDGEDTDPPYLGPPVTVDQRAWRGRWASLGTWTVPAEGKVTIVLGNQPLRAGDEHEVTVSSARAACRW
ncbi:hypothetical protein HII36_52110 [Nonomuraea sp. NN258]|nr:hypothetical protein [Nonomuraea antri]